jgi:hypothetical protein
MDDSVQPLFAIPSCAVFGRRRATSKPMPERVTAYSGTLPMRDAPEALVDRLIAQQCFSVALDAPKPSEALSSGGSIYREAFRNGATLFPRMLCLVGRKQLGRVGPNPSAPLVASYRTQQEKKPWRDLEGIESQVEVEILRPILLGESIAPYRTINAFEGVVPVDASGQILDSTGALGRGFDHLASWMRKAENFREQNRRSERYRLIELFDYFAQLTSQSPIRRLRVVYAASGSHPAACIVRDTQAVSAASYETFKSSSPTAHLPEATFRRFGRPHLAQGSRSAFGRFSGAFLRPVYLWPAAPLKDRARMSALLAPPAHTE